MRLTKRYEDGSIALERHVTLSEALQRLAQFEDIAFEPSNNTPCPGYSQYRSKTPGRDYLSAGTIVAVRKSPASPSITFQNNFQNNFQSPSATPIHTKVVCVRDLGGAGQKESGEGEVVRRKAEGKAKNNAECSDKCANACGGCGGKCGSECGSKCGSECEGGKEGEASHAEEHGNNAPCTSVPCKVGDMLFVLTPDSPIGYEIIRCESVEKASGPHTREMAFGPCIVDEQGNAKWAFYPEDFGVKVFLNRQELLNVQNERRGERKEEAGHTEEHGNTDSYVPVPCKPGDTLYILNSSNPYGYESAICSDVYVKDNSAGKPIREVARAVITDNGYFGREMRELNPEDFGTRAFLNLDDAWNALVDTMSKK